MALFNYRNLSAQAALDLAVLSHKLATAAAMPSIGGVNVGAVLDAGIGALPPGTLDGSNGTLPWPSGWSGLGVADLGLPADLADGMGYIKIESPLTGFAESGPQVRVAVERDSAGQVVRMALSYAGTNSPVDLPDYFQLNEGTIAPKLEPVLAAVRAYAESHGLTGADVVVTGYSLGGGMVNIQSRFADTLAGGFFADSSYVGHASPVIDASGRVMNLGYENDVVFRLIGDKPDLASAAAAGGVGLVNPDYDLAHATDNVILFDGIYGTGAFDLGGFGLLNLAGWSGHLGGMATDAIGRIGASAFYDLMEEDSAVIISNLGAALRPTTWVEDRATAVTSHRGEPAFLIGTAYADLIRDGASNDYIDAGVGDDVIRVSTGVNRVEGGAGTDTLRLGGWHTDWSVYRLGDGTLAFDRKDGTGLTLATGIERVDFEGLSAGNSSVINWPYSVQADRLEDEHWSPFEWGDNDVAYGRATEGTGGADRLAGRVVFGQGGNDLVSGTSGRDLLHGGAGNDTITLGTSGDRGYGGEGHDRIVSSAGGVRLNGGLGDDTFVFTAAVRGQVVIEDFDALANGNDRIEIARSHFSDWGGVAGRMAQDGDDVVIRGDLMTIRLTHTDLGQIGADDFLFT
ncbi:calcium-binding protein [Paracoccus sp. p4-l81]|uniref:calcium-binding protein n=1 Tax=Paracoccus sp. p4-l81 TaxID=3342806 RepID=UPI0035B9AEAE